MVTRRILIAGCILVLGACTSIEGTYLPACAAYSGSEIRLESGRFLWSKFTDQVALDENGNVVEPFPGFPLEGSYRIDGQILTLVPDAGQPPETLYIHEEASAVFLLTAAEHARLKSSGERAECALQKQSGGTRN